MRTGKKERVCESRLPAILPVMYPLPVVMLLLLTSLSNCKVTQGTNGQTAKIMKVRVAYDSKFDDLMFIHDKTKPIAKMRSLMQQANDVVAQADLHVFLTEKIEQIEFLNSSLDQSSMTADQIHAQYLTDMEATRPRSYHFLVIVSALPALSESQMSAIVTNDSKCGASVTMVNAMTNPEAMTMNFKGARIFSDQQLVQQIVRGLLASLGIRHGVGQCIAEGQDFLHMPTCVKAMLEEDVRSNLTECLRPLGLRQSGTPICGNSVVEYAEPPMLTETCDFASFHKHCRTCCSHNSCTTIPDCTVDLSDCRTDKGKGGMIAGIVVGILLLLALVGVVLFFLLRGKTSVHRLPVDKHQSTMERKKSDQELRSFMSGQKS